MKRFRIIEVPKPEPVGEMYVVQMKGGIFGSWAKITGDSYFQLNDAKKALAEYRDRDKKVKVIYSE